MKYLLFMLICKGKSKSESKINWPVADFLAQLWLGLLKLLSIAQELSHTILTFLVMVKDNQIFMNSVTPETFWRVPEFENLIKTHEQWKA